MDRGESAIGKLIAVAALALVAGMSSAAQAPTLEALKWTEPGAEYAVLSSQPATCLQFQYHLEQSVRAGQALFNSPALLGGQAAKAGLSCASCHRNGRSNPHFLLNGISGSPGTADVTNSFFSAARGNGRFDPVPIPDLAVRGKISHERREQALEKFIRNLIVEEFAGREPSFLTLEAVSEYVRALRRCDGHDGGTEPASLRDQLRLIEFAMRWARGMALRGDWDDVRLALAAARHQLGLISERYAGASFKRERAALLDQSRKLQEIANGPADSPAIQTALGTWWTAFDDGLAKRLLKQERQSLYNTKLLAKAFSKRE